MAADGCRGNDHEGPGRGLLEPRSGVIACLDPRQPQQRTSTSWLPDDGESHPELLYGTPAPVESEAAKTLARRFASELGAEFSPTTISEFRTGNCVTRRFVSMTGTDQGTAQVDVFQLRRPIGSSTFPIGAGQRRRLGDGSEMVLGDFDQDGSRVSVALATPEGLLVRVVVASAHSRDVSGWPTTTTGTSNAPHTPAARSLDQVATITQALVGPATGQP